MTLRLRLLLILVGIVAFGLVVADVVTYTSLRSYLYSQIDQQLQTAATPVAQVLWNCYNDEENPFGIAQRACSARIGSSQIPAGTYGQLRDANGQVLYSACLPTESAASSTPGFPASLAISQTLNGASVFSVSNTGCGSASYSGIAVTTDIGTAAGNVAVVVAIPLTGVDQTLGRLELIEILVSIAVLVALGALAWWVVRRGLRPLEEMATTAGAIAAGDLSRRVDEADTQTEV
ncbi:MAG: HAMP domain-containing protein, partial [Rhizomicrobium sp.]